MSKETNSVAPWLEIWRKPESRKLRLSHKRAWKDADKAMAALLSGGVDEKYLFAFLDPAEWTRRKTMCERLKNESKWEAKIIETALDGIQSAQGQAAKSLFARSSTIAALDQSIAILRRQLNYTRQHPLTIADWFRSELNWLYREMCRIEKPDSLHLWIFRSPSGKPLQPDNGLNKRCRNIAALLEAAGTRMHFGRDNSPAAVKKAVQRFPSSPINRLPIRSPWNDYEPPAAGDKKSKT